MIKLFNVDMFDRVYVAPLGRVRELLVLQKLFGGDIRFHPRRKVWLLFFDV